MARKISTFAVMEELFINGVLAKSKGIRLGAGALDALRAPLPMKDYVYNDSRLMDGVEAISLAPKVARRSLSLTFGIHGATPEEHAANLEWLKSVLYQEKVVLKIPFLNRNYHLYYTGKNVSYGETLSHCSSMLTVGFDEPNPKKNVEYDPFEPID